MLDITIYPIIGNDAMYGSGNAYYRHGLSLSNGVTVTASSSTNTKGSYAELVASTSYEYQQLLITIADADATTDDKLIDIAIGAGGSEKVIIQNIQVTCDDQVFSYCIFDIKVPSGSRISARLQSTSGSATAYVSALGAVRNDFEGSYFITTIGANTADSGGTGVDPGGSFNTKGSWVELTASSTYNLRGFNLRSGKRANSADSAIGHLIDVGVGSAGSEKVIAADIGTFSSIIEKSDVASGPYYVGIPAGSRVAVRAQASSADATDRLADVILHGIV
jgi:hypothetical protein